MTIDYAVKVDIGIKETNDDRALISKHIVDMDTESGHFDTPCSVIVCDGCGGYAGGYVAARTILETFQEEDAQALLDENYLAEVLLKCKQAVYAKKEEMPDYSAMCSTIAGCVFGDESIMIFHAGDSRVYRFDGKYLAQMTVDHSLVQGLVDMGKITPEEALTSPSRNVIDRCIGIECLPPEIRVVNVPIGPGETFILCSDGLWECVSKETLIETLKKDISLEDMAKELIAYALENGSEDNITVCLCRGEGEAIVDEDDEDDLI